MKGSQLGKIIEFPRRDNADFFAELLSTEPRLAAHREALTRELGPLLEAPQLSFPMTMPPGVDMTPQQVQALGAEVNRIASLYAWEALKPAILALAKRIIERR